MSSVLDSHLHSYPSFFSFIPALWHKALCLGNWRGDGLMSCDGALAPEGQIGESAGEVLFRTCWASSTRWTSSRWTSSFHVGLKLWWENQRGSRWSRPWDKAQRTHRQSRINSFNKRNKSGQQQWTKSREACSLPVTKGASAKWYLTFITMRSEKSQKP